MRKVESVAELTSSNSDESISKKNDFLSFIKLSNDSSPAFLDDHQLFSFVCLLYFFTVIHFLFFYFLSFFFLSDFVVFYHFAIRDAKRRKKNTGDKESIFVREK